MQIASNIMFANVKGKSQKPDEIYELIEKMMPGSKKVELFARNNNLRHGWLSLGNQLGENYQAWQNIVNCDSCHKHISVNIQRYKSRIAANYDLCQKCYLFHFSSPSSSSSVSLDTNSSGITFNGHHKQDFFVLKNNIDEDILHQYYSCNICNSEPIWGNRFHCTVCDNFDLCEACFDKQVLEAGESKPKSENEDKNEEKNQEKNHNTTQNTSQNTSHVLTHLFSVIEVTTLSLNFRFLNSRMA